MLPGNRAAGGGGMTSLLYIACYALLLCGMGYYYFNDAGNVRLPRPRDRYYFDSNETQLVIAEAHKAADRQQRLLTGAKAMLLALQSSTSQKNTTASAASTDTTAKTGEVLLRDNADLWKLAMSSSLNMTDLSFPIDDAGTRARLSDYSVRALTAYDVALRTTTEEEADLAELIDYVQLFNRLWRELASEAFHAEGGLSYLSQAQMDLEWLSEWAEESMKPSDRLNEQQARAARRQAREARRKASTTADAETDGDGAMTLNLRLLQWLRTHPATPTQAADIRRFLITQSRLWARRERLSAQQRADYAARGGSREAPNATDDGTVPSSSASSSSGAGTREGGVNDVGNELDESTRLNALLSLSDAEWRAREAGVKVGVHVMLAADNGTYSGLPELHFIHAAMRFTTRLDLGGDCQGASFGFLERPRRDPLTLRVLDPAKDAHAIQYVPVLAVTTGIYVSRAAVCTAAVAALPMFVVKSMTFLGTAGVSPVLELGGWSPEATTAHLYSTDRTMPSRRASFHAGQAQPTTSHANTEAAMTSEWSATPTTTTTMDRAAWTRAELEAAVNPQCQSEWRLRLPGDEAAADTWSVSPVFRYAPAVRRAREATERRVSLGSVCVTAAALLQECGLCTEENPRASLCSHPQCAMHNSTTFFGPCAFAQRAGRRLGSGYAEDLKGAMFFQAFPPIPPVVQAGMTQFWSAQEALAEYEPVDTEGSATSYKYNRAPPESPIVLNCAEADTSQILAGIRSDVLCRDYARALLFPVHAAPSEELAQELREMAAKLPLTCVQAMEGLGFLTVMTRQYPDVPVAIVRGASNYDAYPLLREEYTEEEESDEDDEDAVAHAQEATETHKEGEEEEASGRVGRSSEPFFQTREQKRVSLATPKPARQSASRHPKKLVRWVQNERFMSPRDYDDYVRASYRYAVETTSAVVLNFFLKENTILPGEETG